MDPEIYAELRAIAGAYFRGQPSHHTLQPTALVHEALIKMGAQAPADRSHFLAVAATAMRQILVDHARAAAAEKRGGGRHQVTLSGVQDGAAEVFDVLAVHELLAELANVDERRARLVELRVFGGLTEEQCAEILEVSLRTVQKDWRGARAWLAVALGKRE